MKRSLVAVTVLMLLSILSFTAVYANDIEQPGRFGLGLAIGYPGLGLSTNTFVADWMSIKAELYPFFGFRDGVLDVDYLFWLHDIKQTSALDFTWFAGPGLAVVYWDGYDRHDGHDKYDKHDRRYYDDHHDNNLAIVIKGAIGLALQFNKQPFDLALEFSPGFIVDEYGSSLWISGMLSSRYYF